MSDEIVFNQLSEDTFKQLDDNEKNTLIQSLYNVIQKYVDAWNKLPGPARVLFKDVEKWINGPMNHSYLNAKRVSEALVELDGLYSRTPKDPNVSITPTIYLTQKQFNSFRSRKQVYKVERLVVDGIVMRDRNNSSGVMDDTVVTPALRARSLALWCLVGEGEDRVLDLAIERLVNTSAIHDDALDANPELAKNFTTSIDQAMTLGSQVKWLTPTIIGHDRTVMLLNGIGLKTNRTGYKARHEEIPRALCAAFLNAIADKWATE